MSAVESSQIELERVRRLYETLGQLSHRVRSIVDPQQLFSEACRFIVEVAGFPSAWIGMIDEDWSQIRPSAAAGAVTKYGAAIMQPRPVSNYQGFLIGPLRRGECQIIGNVATDPRTQQHAARATVLAVKSLGVFPIQSRTTVIGLLVVHAEMEGALGPHEAALLSHLADMVGLALEHLDRQRTEQKIQKTEQERQKLQEQLSSIISTVPGVICSWRLTQDGRMSVPFAGPALYQLYGVHPFEVLHDALPILKRVHPDDQPQVLQRIQTSAEQMVPWQQDFRFEHPQKGWIWVEGHAMPQREPDGNILWHGFVHDVTERKRSEENLRQSEARFRALFLHSPVAYHSLDAEGRFLNVNERLCELVGFSREELIGKSFDTVWPIEFRTSFDSFLSGFLSSGQTCQELTILRRDGTRMEARIEGHVQRSDSAEFVQTHCVLYDITEQKKAEHGLRLQSAALAAAANAIVITDPSGRVEWCNPAFLHMSGYSEDEVKGHYLGEMVRSGQQSRGFYRQMWDAILAGQPWHGELTNRRKDGSQYPEQMSITPLISVHRKITHFIAIKQDISEQKRLEALLLRTQRLESIGRLASGIAHDLNNVLTPMLMAPLMLRSVVDDPTALQVVDSIESSARRGAAIIKQLLTFSRGLPGERIPVRLRPLAKEMLKLLEQTFPKNITLTTRFARDVWPVFGDPTQLHQVLMNLCVNARDAMPHGGTLTIALENTTLHEQAARVHGVRAGSYSVMEVGDTGIGISSDDLDRIYDPFFTTKPLGEGTGLGLSTALGIVKSHHGVILVDSVLHKGTTFRVLLPAYESNTSPTQVGPSAEVLPVGSGQQILVVDDEELTRQMIHQILEQHGYHVLLAQSGGDALATIRNHPDLRLILTDVMMPGMDGVSMIRQLRSTSHSAKVLIMTGLHSQPDVLELVNRYGVQQLDKPFTAKSLLQAVSLSLHSGPDPSDASNS